MNEAVYLFSYGTLQLDQVQRQVFDRVLRGEKDKLKGYTIENLRILDPAVVQKSGKEYHPMAVPSDRESDEVEGTLFRLSQAELELADTYEVSDYKRIQVQFHSGKRGWVYVGR